MKVTVNGNSCSVTDNVASCWYILSWLQNRNPCEDEPVISVANRWNFCEVAPSGSPNPDSISDL